MIALSLVIALHFHFPGFMPKNPPLRPPQWEQRQ
jgi:hypothetical protein